MEVSDAVAARTKAERGRDRALRVVEAARQWWAAGEAMAAGNYESMSMVVRHADTTIHALRDELAAHDAGREDGE